MAGAARGLGIPRVCHHRFPFAKEGIDWFNKFGAERHLFVSRALMEQMCATSARLRERPCVVVYDGLELPPRPSSEDRTRARDQLQLPPDRRVVTFAGQIVRRKGVADLLHAWVRLPADVAGTALLLIIGEDLQGQGAYRAEMEQFARDLHCPARFVGFQKNVGTWLLASDVAVVPSHVEPLGNATLEAMSYALPVIGGAVGGIPEMVVHEETGLLVPPRAPDQLAAALTRLLGDDAWRQRLGEQGRLRCERLFALRAHVENVMRQYDQVLHDVAEVARIQG
jgi:glycosyltransferase involved in cell wall biosynthesis